MDDKQYKMEINSTKIQVEEFKQSILWQDIQRELKFWSEGFNQEMKSIVDESAVSNPTTASVLLHMGDLNGRMKAVEYMMGLLDVFLDILEENKNDS